MSPTTPSITIPADLLPADGRFGSGPSKVRTDAVRALAEVGSSFLGPESGRIAKIVETEGAASPNAQARIKRIFLISRIELVLLLLVVIDMVVKPGA